MKISVSLPDEDVAALDEFAQRTGLPSRSAAVLHAVRLLRHPDLESDYAEAWEDFESSGEAAAWAAATGDGLDRAQG